MADVRDDVGHQLADAELGPVGDVGQPPDPQMQSHDAAQGGEAVFSSHAIKSDSSSGLANEDYGTFLDERLNTVVPLIERVTGRSLEHPRCYGRTHGPLGTQGPTRRPANRTG